MVFGKFMDGYSAESAEMSIKKRERFREILYNRFKMPVVGIRVVYPLGSMNNEIYTNILNTIYDMVNDIFQYKVHCKALNFSSDGLIANIVIDDDVEKIKEATVDIEEKHILGSCVDIDVFDNKGIHVKRQEVGREDKKCSLCNGILKDCIREKRHSDCEITNFIEKQYNIYMDTFFENKKTFNKHYHLF